MTLLDLPEHVLVMGLGVHGGGLGVARWLLRQGVHITVTDKASEQALAKPLAALDAASHEPGSGSVRYVLGEHHPTDFASHKMVVANAAVRPDSPWLKIAREAGCSIESEMTLFFRVCPSPILGITGTKGKTTTAMLTAAMLRQYHPDTVLAGNLRVSALEALDQITPTTPVVLELSSFQLVMLGNAQLSPSYACLINLSPDHLNYHATMEEYAEAKRQIFYHQRADGVIVVNQADTHVWFGDRQAMMQQHIKTFSSIVGSDADCSVLPDGTIHFCGEPIAYRDDIRLPGGHNLANVLAATALVRSFGIDAPHIQSAIRTFTGVEHRLEQVAVIDGVQYINDTTATNPAAAQAALQSFDDVPIILIAGGADKRLGFGTFPQEIVQRAKAVVLLDGTATEQLKQHIQMELSQQSNQANPQFIRGAYDDFEQAVKVAQHLAAPGDIVLLSPGCASFGMFRNEFHRGEEFRRIVHMIANECLPVG